MEVLSIFSSSFGGNSQISLFLGLGPVFLVVPLSGPVVDVEEYKAETDYAEE